MRRPPPRYQERFRGSGAHLSEAGEALRRLRRPVATPLRCRRRHLHRPPPAFLAAAPDLRRACRTICIRPFGYACIRELTRSESGRRQLALINRRFSHYTGVFARRREGMPAGRNPTSFAFSRPHLRVYFTSGARSGHGMTLVILPKSDCRVKIRLPQPLYSNDGGRRAEQPIWP